MQFSYQLVLLILQFFYSLLLIFRFHFQLGEALMSLDRFHSLDVQDVLMKPLLMRKKIEILRSFLLYELDGSAGVEQATRKPDKRVTSISRVRHIDFSILGPNN